MQYYDILVLFLNDNKDITDFLNDNTDNRNNGKNGRNCGCHEVTYNTDNGDYFFVIVVSVVF